MLDDLRDELAAEQLKVLEVRATLTRAQSLRWTRLGRRLGLVPPARHDEGPVADAERRADDPDELAEIRAQIVDSQRERQRLLHELQALYDRSWMRFGDRGRRGLTRLRGRRGITDASPAAPERSTAPERSAGRPDEPDGAPVLSTDLHEVLASARQRAETDTAAEPARLAAVLAGQLRVLDPTWLPTIASGGAHPSPPGGPARVTTLHLLESSAPYVTDDSTTRARQTLSVQRLIGLEPVAVTSLGFPRLLGIDDVPPTEIVDGVVHHRLDLGPAYDARRVPADRLVTDAARQASRVAASVRPAVLHAGPGLEQAVVALSLRRHFGTPVVYHSHPRPDGAQTTPAGEHSARLELRRARELDCMRRADLVVVDDEEGRRRLLGQGLPAENAVVIPTAVDTATSDPAPAIPTWRAGWSSPAAPSSAASCTATDPTSKRWSRPSPSPCESAMTSPRSSWATSRRSAASAGP